MEEHLEELLMHLALHEFCDEDYADMLNGEGTASLDNYYTPKERLDVINSLNGESDLTLLQRQIIGM